MQFKRNLRLSLTAQAFSLYSVKLVGCERNIVVQSLIDIFQKTKEVLFKYDYYIYTQKRVLHLTNSELKIPHLMGLQYIGRPNQFTGDFGVYSIKKKRITHESIDRLVRKYYRTEEKQQTGNDPVMDNLPWEVREDRKSTRLNSSHDRQSRMPSSA